MRRIGLAMVIVGIGMIVGQGFIADLIIPLVTLAYPNASHANIANGSGIAINVVGYSMVIAGIAVFLIYRNRH